MKLRLAPTDLDALLRGIVSELEDRLASRIDVEHRARGTEFVTRAATLELLSDDDIARLSTREAGAALAVGEEYVDLKHLKNGVRRMTATTRVKISDVLRAAP